MLLMDVGMSIKVESVCVETGIGLIEEACYKLVGIEYL